MFEKLPWFIIQEILLFDSRFVYRNKKLLFIDKIPRNDERYSLLSKIPRIYKMSSNSWNVILSEPITKKRFILGYHSEREYFFHTFTYNHQMREMNKSPDNMICFFSSKN
jgi:hypothetical protein